MVTTRITTFSIPIGIDSTNFIKEDHEIYRYREQLKQDLSDIRV